MQLDCGSSEFVPVQQQHALFATKHARLHNDGGSCVPFLQLARNVPGAPVQELHCHLVITQEGSSFLMVA